MALILPQTAPSGVRRESTACAPAGIIRAASVVLCGLCATTGVSHAMVTAGIAGFGDANKVPLGLDPTRWTDWSQNCYQAGGTSGCDYTDPARPDPNPNDLLFSWGTAGSSDNSTLELTYTGSDTRTLGSIRFTSVKDQPLGPGVIARGGPGGATNYSPLSLTPSTGAGTMVAYEPWDPDNTGGTGTTSTNMFFHTGANANTNTHYVSDQRMNISVERGSSTVKSVPGWLVAVDQGMDGVRDGTTDFLEVDAQGVPRGIEQYEIDQRYYFGTPGSTLETVELEQGDILRFTFYEAVVDNEYANRELPDAYYGDFEVTLDEPGLIVDAVDFGAVRAGTSGTQQTMTADNFSAATLNNVVFDAVTPLAPEDGTLTPLGPSTPTSLDLGESTTRTFDYTAPADRAVDDTAAQDFSATQTVSATGVDSATTSISGKIVGPVLGVNDGNEYLDYDSEISLAVNLDTDSEALKTLALSNIFGEDFGLLDDLTLYSAAITGDAAFSIGNLGDFTNSVERTASAGESFTDLQLRFAPGPIGDYTGVLTFVTDMNEAYVGDNTSGLIPTNSITFSLTGEATASSVPLPGSIVLLLTGLVGFGVFGRRQSGWGVTIFVPSLK